MKLKFINPSSPPRKPIYSRTLLIGLSILYLSHGFLRGATLVASFPFDGNVNDTTGNGYNGIVQNATLTTDRFGVPNAAYAFNGISSYIQIPGSGQLDNQAFTICAWVNFSGVLPGNTAGAGAVFTRLWNGSNASSFQDVVSLQSYVNENVAYYNGDRQENATGPCGDVSLHDTNAFTPGDWTFVCVSKQGRWFKTYINGALRQVADVGCELDPYVHPGDWLLGAQFDYGSVWAPWLGKIDDVKLFSGELSLDEIISLYVSDADTTTGLVAEYPFSGNANDTTGNGHDGITQNATLTTDRFGFTDAAYAFNGNASYIQIPASPQLDNTNFSVCAWVNFSGVLPGNTAGGGTVFTRLWNGSNTSSLQDVVGLQSYFNENVTLYNGDRLENSTGSCGEASLHDTNAFSLGDWTFVCVTKQGKLLKTYLNGSLCQAADLGCELNPYVNPADWLIGAQIDFGGVWAPWLGKIDDVKMYNRGLLDFEVASLYHTGKPWLKTLGQNLTVGVGASPTLGILAVGSPLITYQWFRNGSILLGQTNAALILNGIQASGAGTYSVVASNSLGSVTNSIKLSVLDLNMFAGLVLAGPVGTSYAIEYRDGAGNPATWHSLTNVILSISPQLFIDSESPYHAQRYYRATALP